MYEVSGAKRLRPTVRHCVCVCGGGGGGYSRLALINFYRLQGGHLIKVRAYSNKYDVCRNCKIQFQPSSFSKFP